MNFAEINLTFTPLLCGGYMNMLDIVTFSLHEPCLTSQDVRKLERRKETNLPIQVISSVKEHPTP